MSSKVNFRHLKNYNHWKIMNQCSRAIKGRPKSMVMTRTLLNGPYLEMFFTVKKSLRESPFLRRPKYPLALLFSIDGLVSALRPNAGLCAEANLFFANHLVSTLSEKGPTSGKMTGVKRHRPLILRLHSFPSLSSLMCSKCAVTYFCKGK